MCVATALFSVVKVWGGEGGVVAENKMARCHGDRLLQSPLVVQSGDCCNIPKARQIPLDRGVTGHGHDCVKGSGFWPSCIYAPRVLASIW